MRRTRKIAIGIFCLALWMGGKVSAAWRPVPGRLMTRWAKEVSPSNAHPEYPRPQMVRADWLNLNGLWDYAVRPKEEGRPQSWDGQILVPFPIESALSGVARRVSEKERVWYRRTFRVPWRRKGWHVLLHFGAVDWETTVWVNVHRIGTHRGGYDSFTFDITDALRPSGEQELVVAVWDPTDAGYQPRGKQVRRPRGIWYTPTTGIWQTVWLEPVPPQWIASFRLYPDIDRSTLTVVLQLAGRSLADRVRAVALDGGQPVATAEVDIPSDSRTVTLRLHIPDQKLWSPDSPFLYGLTLTLRKGQTTIDRVRSYFGMRKIHVAKDRFGIPRLFLNNRPLFQFGPLDQGFWPDGLYTAPTDEALRYDIQMTKRLGFNMCRKHVKVEPDRWYYWCDRLGLLVWQDMPSGDRFIGRSRSDIQRSPESAQQFLTELKALIDGRFNHPCIVMWVPYNEGWGQWNTKHVVELIRRWDPTRLVDNASGWADRGVGDVVDMHRYPGPDCPQWDDRRAAVLGEFGGLGLPIRGHTWQEERNWGYRSYQNPDQLFLAYKQLIDKLPRLIRAAGLSAAVYTQITDVETEVNGLMTYDRAVVKMGVDRVAALNRKVYQAIHYPERSWTALTPPAVPLVACDPYFSVWSFTDRLTDDFTRHWTGTPQALISLVRIDGKPYRLMGIDPADVPALPQRRLEVRPTQTIYEFVGAGVRITLTFTTPMIPYDLELLSRLVTYLTWKVESVDGLTHKVELYFDNTAELVVNTSDQKVDWIRQDQPGLRVLRFGSVDQMILARSGDNLRIDWGYLYTAAPEEQVQRCVVANSSLTRQMFAKSGEIPETMDRRKPRPARDAWPVAAFRFKPMTVAPYHSEERWLMLAYDDLYSIQYMGQNLRPYGRRNGWTAKDLLEASLREYASIRQRCDSFDWELMNDLRRVGGERYARLAALAYRQAFAANKFVADTHGQPLAFCKECFSNGCIGTVDVIYPMSPLFLLFGPSLTKAMLVPILNYADSPRWRFPFAPHDLGQYPLANGQVYGGGERSEQNQMPVEETGNLLILLAALAHMEGNADFAAQYWPLVRRWAEYLKQKGFDPENQLCTDDFAGHLAHNANLSIKAICGLAAFAKLAEMHGDQALAREYRELAHRYAQQWVQAADDGDHFRLAFDRPGTWSQKYNMVWDAILGFHLWPQEVKEKEMRYYRRIQNRYGLPLDNRALYTKLDWILWTATLTQRQEDFEALLDPVYDFLNDTPDRVPMTDWYWTHNGRRRGFQARPVVGGVFLRMLYEPEIWKKYASRDQTRAAGWAPLPKPPKVVVLLPTAEEQSVVWRYTTQKPGSGWNTIDFDDRSWKEGPAGFGVPDTPGAKVRTLWNTSDIWIRRTFSLRSVPPLDSLRLRIHHDEDAEVYLNGVLAARLTGYTVRYIQIPIRPQAVRALRQGTNLIAIHCHQTGGGQYIDAGLVQVIPPEEAQKN